jgi:hypothetical protein
MNNKPYRDFAGFLSARFPFKVQKISINAGFTCPNRDGSKGRGGCTYCNNQSFSPEYGKPTKTISEQMADGIDFFSRKYPEMKYLAYFQSYTNTYDRIASLTDKYEEALVYPGVVGLMKNYEVTDKIIKRFQERNTCQGRLYHQENGLQ